VFVAAAAAVVSVLTAIQMNDSKTDESSNDMERMNRNSSRYGYSYRKENVRSNIFATSSSVPSKKKEDFNDLHAEWDEFDRRAVYGDDDEEEEEDEEEDEDESWNAAEENEPSHRDESIIGQEEEDDYSDLPEEDEPTTCSICLINRQGPCRNPWRRFEKCMKVTMEETGENSIEDEEEQKSSLIDHCSQSSIVWLHCLEKHRLTYAILTNEHYHPEILGVEEKIGHDRRSSFPEQLGPPRVDLTHWFEYQRAIIYHEDDLDQEDEPAQPTPNDQTETFLAGYAYFPLHDTTTGNSIFVAYVRDQDGNLLGFDHFGKEKKEGKKESELMFHITPNTTSITAFAIYKKQSEDNKESVKHDTHAAKDLVDSEKTKESKPTKVQKTNESKQSGVLDDNKGFKLSSVSENDDEGQLYSYSVSTLLPEDEEEDVP